MSSVRTKLMLTAMLLLNGWRCPCAAFVFDVRPSFFGPLGVAKPAAALVPGFSSQQSDVKRTANA
jgi:hypothetical protein